MRWGLRQIGCCYQPFIHDPARIDAMVAASGFRMIDEPLTAWWITRTYRRDRHP